MTSLRSDPPLPSRPAQPPPAAVSQAILERCCKELTPCHGRSQRTRLVMSISLSATVVLALLGLAWSSHLREHSTFGVAGIALAWGLLQLTVLVVGLAQPPGRRPSQPQRWAAVAVVLVLALLQPVLLLLGGTCSRIPPRVPGLLGTLNCLALSFLCGALVTGAMLWIWRRTDPFSPRLSGSMLGLSGGLAGAVGVGFTCNDHGVSHLWLGHFTVIILLTFLGKIAGKRCLTP